MSFSLATPHIKPVNNTDLLDLRMGFPESGSGLQSMDHNGCVREIFTGHTVLAN